MPASPGHRRAASLSEGLRGLGDMGAGVLRGAVTSSAGQFGDMEGAARDFFGSTSPRFLPTSEEISDYLPQTGADTKTAETLGGYIDPKRLVNALRGKGAATVAKAISVPADWRQAIDSVNALKKGDHPNKVWLDNKAYRVPSAPIEVTAPNTMDMAKEIPTTGIGMNPKVFDIPSNRIVGKPLRLRDDSYEFKDLVPGFNQMYKDFPHVAKLPVEARSSNSKSFGHYDRATNVVHVNPEAMYQYGRLDQPRETLYHELQHHFQDLFGWPGGTSPDWMKADPRAAKAMADLLRDPAYMKLISKPQAKLMQNVGDNMSNPYDAYLKEFGEQQAWGTSIRDKISPLRREVSSPLQVGYLDPKGGYSYDQFDRYRTFANQQGGVTP